MSSDAKIVSVMFSVLKPVSILNSQMVSMCVTSMWYIGTTLISALFVLFPLILQLAHCVLTSINISLSVSSTDFSQMYLCSLNSKVLKHFWFVTVDWWTGKCHLSSQSLNQSRSLKQTHEQREGLSLVADVDTSRVKASVKLPSFVEFSRDATMPPYLQQKIKAKYLMSDSVIFYSLNFFVLLIIFFPVQIFATL